MKYSSRITGTGSAFPERRYTNDELAQDLAKKGIETSDAWIRERTGIQERRMSAPGKESEFNSSLSLKASLQALEMAGKKPTDIDLILFATVSPDVLVPATACLLQKNLGATNAWAFDLNGGCSGWLYGLTIADQFIQNGKHKTILLVGAEVLTTFLNWKDRTTCILFGDAAGATVIEQVPSDHPRRIVSTHMGSDGNLSDLFYLPAGGSRQEVTPEIHAQGLDKMQMKGKEIFKVAVKTLADYAVKALQANQLNASDIQWLIPHQANLRIIEAVARRLDFPMERILTNVERFGNTSSASVPLTLDENIRNGKIKPGDTLLLDVFGAGLTYGSVVMRW